MKFFIMLVVSFGLLFSSVDINTASSDELTSLKGIGPSKARAIVAYRNNYEKFFCAFTDFSLFTITFS